jgi:CBS domain-containing protein
LVDDKNLFMFKTPPLNIFKIESAFYLNDTFYSTDPSQIERVIEMLSDIWKRGIDISEISSQAGTKLPTIEVQTNDTVAQIIQKMLQNNVNSIMITKEQKPLGIINDRDVLREIIEQRRDPMKTKAKDLNYTPLILLKEDESLVTAMRLMSERGFNRAAMVKNGQLIGMLTEEAAKKATMQLKVTA